MSTLSRVPIWIEVIEDRVDGIKDLIERRREELDRISDWRERAALETRVEAGRLRLQTELRILSMYRELLGGGAPSPEGGGRR